MTPNLSLGYAMAYLKMSQHGSIIKDITFPDADRTRLQVLAERKNMIVAEQRSVELIDSIPASPCVPGRYFLSQNDDFFLNHLVCDPKDSKDPECEKLFRHTNDCFRCFVEYSSVLRDYYHMSEHLQK